MTLIISITGTNMKDLQEKLAKAELKPDTGFKTFPDGSTINHQYYTQNYESLAAYHNSLMEETYGLARR